MGFEVAALSFERGSFVIRKPDFKQWEEYKVDGEQVVDKC